MDMGEKRFKFALDGRKRKRILTDVSPYSFGGLRTVRFDYREIFEFRLTCRGLIPTGESCVERRNRFSSL